MCLVTKECQFNLKTVLDFETVYPQCQESNPNRLFSNYLKVTRQAVESAYQEKFAARMNSGMLKTLENVLDPGF